MRESEWLTQQKCALRARLRALRKLCSHEAETIDSSGDSGAPKVYGDG